MDATTQYFDLSYSGRIQYVFSHTIRHVFREVSVRLTKFHSWEEDGYLRRMAFILCLKTRFCGIMAALFNIIKNNSSIVNALKMRFALERH